MCDTFFSLFFFVSRLSEDNVHSSSREGKKRGRLVEMCSVLAHAHTVPHTYTCHCHFSRIHQGSLWCCKAGKRASVRVVGRGGRVKQQQQKKEKEKRKRTILTGEDNSKRKHGSFCVPPLMSRGFTHSIGTACCVVPLTAPLLR